MASVEATVRPSYWHPGAGLHRRPPPTIEQLMLSEQTHRIANDMQAVMCSLELVKRRDAETAGRLVEDAIARVRLFSDVQRLLIPPVTAATVEISRRLEDVCRRIARLRLAERNVLLDFAVDRCVMDERVCWTICAVVAELVTNAAKHAFATAGGTLAVTGRRVGRIMVFSVADDGRGAPEPRIEIGIRPKGAGSAIVDGLVAALGGELHRPVTAIGTTVEFWVGLDR